MTAARRPRSPVSVVLVAPLVALLAGCSMFGGGSEGDKVSVFDLEAGDCLRTPQDVTAELTSLTQVGCDLPHELEAYAVVAVREAEGATGTYPGDAAAKAFADGACAEQFADYVGVDYRDSRLFFTYLVPSTRSWEQDGDRDVTCLVTTTGEQLTQSVAGTQW